MTKLGVAVVGLGVGEAHARAYLATGTCELRQLYDLDQDRAHRLATELGTGAAVRTYDEVLADPDVHVVSIASADDAHFEQTLAALEAGKHVFVEKPLCRSLEELRTLRSALDARPELQLASNLVLRGAPLWAWLRRRCEEGAFGDVYAFDGDYLYGRLHKITDGWRQDVQDYSVMLGGGVHLVDLMLWTTGQRPTRVTAAGNRISSEGTSFRYLDFVAATFEFPSGLVGRVTANFGSVARHQHVVRVFGTKATVVNDDQGPRIQRARDPGEDAERLDLAALPATKAELIPEFVQRILDGGTDVEATKHDFDVIRACVAADRAVAEGGSVDIDYD